MKFPGWLVVSLTFGVGAFGAGALGCSTQESSAASLGFIESHLTAPERRARARQIREAAAAHGITNGLLLAGVAEAETGLAHCWSEATWACRGPMSADCDGPVIAGAGDGPCEREQGGLGMFQFDAGTYEQTLEREGDRVLSLDGNVEAAVDFIVNMVIRSVLIDVDTEEQAIAWLNEVRPWNDQFGPWTQTVTQYYNGCRPGVCSVYEERLARYGGRTISVMNEMGADFWYGQAPACGPIPAQGALLEETDGCFGAGGDPDFWRTEATGSGGSLLWTNATDSTDPQNWAFFNLDFQKSGAYLLETYVDASIARSTQAAYLIERDESLDRVVLDQTAQSDFRSLGVFRFQAGGVNQVRIEDNTGEPTSDPRPIVVDALRISRVPGLLRTFGGPKDAEIPPPNENYTLTGGCSAVPGASGPAPMWCLLALALFLRRRPV